jgi:hypothetical protein
VSVMAFSFHDGSAGDPFLLMRAGSGRCRHRPVG